MARKGTGAGPSFTRPTRPAGGLRRTYVAFAAALPLFFCGALHTVKAQDGRLEIRVKDHREAIEDFSRLTLQIAKVAISPKAGLAFWKAGWRQLSPTTSTIDLTQYTGGQSVAVFKGIIDAGTFDGIQLRLEGIDGVLKKNRHQAQVKNVLTPIKLSFSVEPKGETVIVLDLVVLDMADHPPRGYELGIQGYEVRINGRLTDKVPPG